MTSSAPKRPKSPSGPPPWNFDAEMDDSEDVSFDDWPEEVEAAKAAGVPADKRPSHRPPRKTIPPDIAGWPPPEGSVLLGKYVVDKILGKGGMGVVVVAHHLQLQQNVAIKFLHPAAMNDPDVVTRFQREARVLAQLQSDHAVHILDVGTLEKGEPYMVMEYLEGTDLSKAVKVRGPLPFDEAVDYVVQACEPLAEAHMQNIIHRDLKPSNLYLARRSDGSYTIKLIDFGISKIQTEAELSMTKTSVILGSPLYISPEQLRSARDVDARSDIWALGVILFKLLTGRPPFLADTIAQLCAMILLNPPPRITETRPDVPLGLEAAIGKCIHKDPAQRFQNVGELVEALAPFLARDAEAHESVTRVRRLMKTAPPLPVPGDSAPTLGEAPPVPRTTVSGVSAVTDGGAALTLAGSAAALAFAEKQRKRRAIATGIGAGLAFLAVIAGVLIMIGIRRAIHPPAVTPPEQVDVLPPPPPTDTAPPPPPPTATATATATAIATTTTTATATTGSAVASVKKPPPPPQVWVPPPGPKKPKPVDNTEFGDRK